MKSFLAGGSNQRGSVRVFQPSQGYGDFHEKKRLHVKGLFVDPNRKYLSVNSINFCTYAVNGE